MSNCLNKPVIAMDYKGKFKLAGIATHRDHVLCRLIHLPNGESEYYPVGQCQVVTSAQALEAAVASGKYDDLSIERLRVAFMLGGIETVLKRQAEQKEQSQ